MARILLFLLLLVTSPSLAATQLNWGVDKTVSPYNVGFTLDQLYRTLFKFDSNTGKFSFATANWSLPTPPAPTAVTLGGVFSASQPGTNYFMTGIDLTGTPTFAKTLIYGSYAANDCLKADASGNIVTAGTVCSTLATPITDRTGLRAANTSYLQFFDGSQWAWDGSNLSSKLKGSDQTSTSVDAGTNTITLASHGLMTGMVVFTTAVDGLSANTRYYVIRVSSSTFRLASSFANAMSGSPFDLTGTSNITFNRNYDPMEGVYVPPSADLSGASGAWVRKNGLTPLYLTYFGADPTGTNYSDQSIAGARDLFEKQLISLNLNGATLDGAGGIFKTQYSVNFTKLRGRGYLIRNLKINCHATGQICLDFTGSNNSTVNEVFVLGDNTDIPHTGVVYAREDDGGAIPYPIAEHNDIGILTIYGWFKCSGFTNIASEVMHADTLNTSNQYWWASAVASKFIASTSAEYCADGLPTSIYTPIGTGDGQSLSQISIDRHNARRSPAYGYAITGISKANPAVVTFSAASCSTANASFGLTSGTGVFLDSVSGSSADWANNLSFKVFSITNLNCGTGTFELVGVDTSAYSGTFTAGTLRNNTGPGVHLADTMSFYEGGGYHTVYSDHFYRIDPRYATSHDGNWNTTLNGRYETSSDYLVKFIGDGLNQIIRNFKIETDNSAVRVALMTCPGCIGASGRIVLYNPEFIIGHNARTPTLGLIFDTNRIRLQSGRVRAGDTIWNPNPTAVSGTCTMSAGACGAQTFPNGQVFQATPNCVVTYVSGTLTAPLKVARTTSSVTPQGSGGSDNATVDWACFGY